MHGTKLREIERLRAIAVIMVMVTHWWFAGAFLPNFARSPWSGVDLFFVISGYVVTLSFMRLVPAIESEATFADAFGRARQALRVFYARRFFRIIPAALAASLLHRALITVSPSEFGTPNVWNQEMVAFFSGLYNYVFPHRAQEFKLGIYWSLSVEEHFYLILPVLFVALRTTQKRLLGCLAIAGLSIAARFIGTLDAKASIPFYYDRFASHLRFDSLMAGVVLALVAGQRAPATPILPKWLPRFVLLPAVIVLVATLPGVATDYVMHRQGFIALWLLSGVLVAYAGLDRGYVLSVPVLDVVLEYLGARSYALYLVHYTGMRIESTARLAIPGYARFVAHDTGAAPWRALLFTTIVTLVLAELLHRLVERPSIRIGRALVSGKAPPVPSRRTIGLAAAAALAFTALLSRHWLLLHFGPLNLAAGKHVTQSSYQAGKPDPGVLTNGILEPELGAHTDRERDPWIEIDLGAPTQIGSMRVYNRADGWVEDQIGLYVSVSNDRRAFRTIAYRESLFSQQWPWHFRTGDITARYVRFHAHRETTLCLSEVEIFHSPRVAALP